jgi:hypothetical protein
MDERKRILDGIQEIEDQSHATKTPLFQDTLLSLIREFISETHPPKRFRDIGKGE